MILNLTILLLLLPALHSELNEGRAAEEWDEYDDENLALSIPKDAVGVPAEFRRQALSAMAARQKINDTVSNHCYCSYGPPICDQQERCLKQDGAACFHAIEEKFDRSDKTMVTMHMYGCTKVERGSGASHITCNSWRLPHSSPKSIKCCYEGNFCNKYLTPHEYSSNNEKIEGKEEEEDTYRIEADRGVLVKILSITFFGLLIFLVTCCMYRLKKKIDKKDSIEDGLGVKTKKLSKPYEKEGSGSDGETLIQRTVALDLHMLKSIGSGRYGTVSKAMYRQRLVAVKTFYTTDEESWRNEREIYKTDMLNNENILQFVAADIFSEDSVTKMLLITEYHELGSLADYLKTIEILQMNEMLHLINSVVCGIEHLHTAIRGTGTWKKPEIVHRDIKSRNIIVKRPGVCCIADFGLALQCKDQDPPVRVKVQVGTKRYMAPEVIQDTLNPFDFSQFKMADVYSTALVIWEIAKKVEKHPTSTTTTTTQVSDSETELSEKSDSSAPPSSKMYMMPYEGTVSNDPSFDDMAKVVCEEGRRPPGEPWWTEDRTMSRLWRLMTESWHTNPSYRHTALKLKKELYLILYPDHELIERKRETQPETETDSGFQSNLNSSLSPVEDV